MGQFVLNTTAHLPLFDGLRAASIVLVLLSPFAFVLTEPPKCVRVSAAVIALAPIARSGAWLFFRQTPYYDLEMFPMVADGLVAGCLLASMWDWLERQEWYLHLFRAADSAALLLNRCMGYTLTAVMGTSVVNLCVGILVHRSVYLSEDWAGRCFNWSAVAFVGMLSCSR